MFALTRESGFTLIELIIVIVLVGILSIGATRFITATVGGYINTAQRQQLATAGLVAAEKVSRELRSALPNSLRPRIGETFPDACLEYIPTVSGTDYITIPIDTVGKQLHVLTPNITLTNTMRMAVYPLNTTDLYSRPNPGPVSPLIASSAGGVGDSSELIIASNHRFDNHSPTRRLYVVSAPRAYCFDGARLYHYSGYTRYEADGRPDAATRLVLLDKLQTGSGQSAFDYLPASLVRNAVVNFQFSLSNGGDSWLTEQEVHIRNVP